jgi:hypothetical protein
MSIPASRETMADLKTAFHRARKAFANNYLELEAIDPWTTDRIGQVLLIEKRKKQRDIQMHIRNAENLVKSGFSVAALRTLERIV